MLTRTLAFAFCLFVVVGCKSKQKEDQLPSNQTQMSQGTLPHTNHAAAKDSVREKGKPFPPLPIEDMTRSQLNEYKQLLTENGFYDCCVEPSCRMCLFEHEECPCQHNIKKNEGVCGECFDKWQIGKGKVKGIKPEEVKKM